MPRSKKTDLTEAGARGAALRALGRREHSAGQLRQKLEQRGHSEASAAATVEQLREAGWQSDTRFAESLARSRIAQGYGPQRIRYELEQAGIPEAEARAQLRATAVDWGALCGALHQRKFGKPPRGAAEWQKQYRYLAAHGFEPGHIRTVLKGEGPE